MDAAEQYKTKHGVYAELARTDFWNLGRKLIGNGWAQTMDGKLTPMFSLAPAVDSPWCHAVVDPDRNCLMWHKIMYEMFGLLPSPCLECWKVVARPKSLDQLFSQFELQKRLGWPSKSGIEVRNYVHGLYGGYWYNNSLEAGQVRWKDVKEAVQGEISPDIDVILKRGCTEFEMKFGPSNTWAVTDEQLKFEELIYEKFTGIDDYEQEQSEDIQRHVQQRWIEWAYQNGDPTALKYNNGNPLWPDTVKYHDLDLSKLQKTTIEVVKKV